MNNLMKKALVAEGVALLFAASLGAATLCENGKSDYAIAVDTNNVFDATAALELQDIFERSTGVKLPIAPMDRRDGGLVEPALPVGTKHWIVIRTDPSLAKNEHYVTEETGFLGLFGGGDVVIRGGGLDGSSFGVYLFCEKVLGYRIFSQG